MISFILNLIDDYGKEIAHGALALILMLEPEYKTNQCPVKFSSCNDDESDEDETSSGLSADDVADAIESGYRLKADVEAEIRYNQHVKDND